MFEGRLPEINCLKNSLYSILNGCIECQLCVEECPFLSKYRKTPKDFAYDLLKGVNQEKGYIMECLLCGLCKVICPEKLDFPSVIIHARKHFSRYIISNVYYRLSLPDDPLFFLKAYKMYKRINYDFIEGNTFEYIFFPGCSMSSFSPETVRKVYQILTEKFGNVGFIDMCCGKPLADIGLVERASKWLLNLKGLLTERGCKSIVVACPMCYYYLKQSLTEFKILTVYEALEEIFSKEFSVANLKITFHDSCPDRFEGRFARKVRSLFRDCEVIEMRHSMGNSMCCGAGGLASIADPSLTVSLSSARVEEFSLTGANLMVVYCYTCAQVFWSTQPRIQTKHALNLMLGTQDLSEDIKSGEIANLVAKLLVEGIENSRG